LNSPEKSLWELLWDYDPNGLVALDASMRVQVVNPAFCRMFRMEASAVIGQPGAPILGDLGDFREVLTTHEPILEREKAFPHPAMMNTSSACSRSRGESSSAAARPPISWAARPITGPGRRASLSSAAGGSVR
jgi:PAS domain-containing protein